MTDRLQPGIKHAPGVMCIIRGIPSKNPASQDNGKIVTLLEQIPLGGKYRCTCGNITATTTRFGIFWQVRGEQLRGCKFVHTTSKARIPQMHLIPIGDSSLIEGEKWEATNPKEDQVEKAISTIMNQLHKQRKDKVL